MGGRPGAWLTMFLAERDRLIRLVGRILGNRSAAEDVVQDAFVKLWGRPVGPEDRGLLVRTAQNLALDRLRAEAVRARHGDSLVVAQLSRPSVSAETTVGEREELAGLFAALAALPIRAQRAFLLNRIDGLTYPEIARRLGVSISTVEKDMIRSLDAVRRFARAAGRD